MNRQLMFVYNANYNLFSLLTDFAHKTLSPATYPCQLCKLTYGNFSMKQEWKSFLEKLPLRSVFLHKNEFLRQYKIDTEFPSIFIRQDSLMVPLLTKKEIEKAGALQYLKDIIMDKLKKYDQHHHSDS